MVRVPVPLLNSAAGLSADGAGRDVRANPEGRVTNAGGRPPEVKPTLRPHPRTTIRRPGRMPLLIGFLLVGATVAIIAAVGSQGKVADETVIASGEEEQTEAVPQPRPTSAGPIPIPDFPSVEDFHEVDVDGRIICPDDTELQYVENSMPEILGDVTQRCNDSEGQQVGPSISTLASGELFSVSGDRVRFFRRDAEGPDEMEAILMSQWAGEPMGLAVGVAAGWGCSLPQRLRLERTHPQIS